MKEKREPQNLRGMICAQAGRPGSIYPAQPKQWASRPPKHLLLTTASVTLHLGTGPALSTAPGFPPSIPYALPLVAIALRLVHRDASGLQENASHAPGGANWPLTPKQSERVSQVQEPCSGSPSQTPGEVQPRKQQEDHVVVSV